MLPHKSLQREIIKIKKGLHALNSRWNKFFFLKPLPSAYNWSVFIGFLGILIMAYCDENCGRFFTPLHSLSTQKSTSGSSQGMPQTECQVCQGNSALIFPETSEDFLSCFWVAWKFGQDMARWCCCSYFMQKNIFVFYYYSVSCFPFFSSVYMLVAQRNSMAIGFGLYSPLSTTNLNPCNRTNLLNAQTVHTLGDVQTLVHKRAPFIKMNRFFITT